LFRLATDPINKVGTIPAQFLQKLNNFGDFAFAGDCELERQDLEPGVEFIFVLLVDKNNRTVVARRPSRPDSPDEHHARVERINSLFGRLALSMRHF
jgi:hypothetical protein